MTLFQAFGQFAGQAAAALPSMNLIVPTSVTYTGTSATINADGSVSTVAVSDLDINGVFTSTYDFYEIVIVGQTTVGAYARIDMQWTNSGTPDTSSNYNYQRIRVSNTAATGDRANNDSQGSLGFLDADDYSILWGYVANPYLAKSSYAVWLSGWTRDLAEMYEYQIRTDTTTSYDGIRIVPFGDSITSLISVYGYSKESA